MTSEDGDPAEWPGVDTERPNIARVYDRLLGGSHNFEADRALAAQGLRLLPNLRDAAVFNRAFLFRAVRFCLRQGVRQFLDLGSGIPTVGNVHEIVHARVPDAPVVYVDHEPIAVEYANLLLSDNPHAEATRADIRSPETIRADPAVNDLLDFDQPIALFLVAVLHSVSDADDPAGLVAHYRSLLAPGSFLVFSHGTPDQGSQQLHDYIELYRNTPSPVYQRTYAEITAMLSGFELMEPGVVWTPEWRPETPDDVPPDPERGFCYAAVGRV